MINNLKLNLWIILSLNLAIGNACTKSQVLTLWWKTWCNFLVARGHQRLLSKSQKKKVFTPWIVENLNLMTMENIKEIEMENIKEIERERNDG